MPDNRLENTGSHAVLRAAFLALALGTLGFVRAGECPAPDGLRIASVEIQGLRHTRRNVVEQEIVQHPGDSFACQTWRREQNRLKDLDIFSEVSLDARPSGDSVALIYRFRELPPYIPMVSVNKTDQDGLSIGPAFASLNFLGTGKRVEAMARFLGTTEYQASVSGRQLFGKPIEFDAAWIHVDSYNPFDRFHENSHRFKAEGLWPWAHGFGVEALGEAFRIQSDTPGITLRRGGDWVPRLGLGFRWDRRDRALLPRDGYYAETRFTQNGGALGGPADFFEQLVDLRAYLRFAARQGLAANVLYQYRHAEGSAMGRYDDFHVGGANTLRGFGENALTGRSEMLWNAEYRLDLLTERIQRLGPWSLNYALQGVLGVDGAGVWNGSPPWPEDFESGLYVGVHLLLPGVERLRLEVASNAVRFDVRVHLGLFEKTTTQRFRTR